jgi:cytochrome c
VEENTLKSPLRTSLVAGVIALGLASLLFHPFGAVKAHTSANPLLAGAVVDSETVQIMERSCQNCHSEKTDWPWYSYVAPVSWLVESDVHRARSHMNLSSWDQYSLKEKEDHLAELAAAVRSRQMPPPRYTLMHRNAKLSQLELDRIYQWARGERRRLKSLSAGAATSVDGGANR